MLPSSIVIKLVPSASWVFHLNEKDLKTSKSKGRDNYVKSCDGELEGDGDGPPGRSRVGQVEVEQSACAAQP